MKKTLVIISIISILIVGTIGVFAGEVSESEDFVAERLTIIEEALVNGTITVEQAELLTAHIEDKALSGEFWDGLGNQGETCVLGEEGSLGLFRNENAGLGQGMGNKGSNGQGNRGQGSRGQGNKGVCAGE